MSLSAVQAALQAAAVAALSGISVAVENAPFTKPAGGAKWAALSFLPITPQPETVGVGGLDRADGILQVDLHYPQGTGDAEKRADLDKLQTAFHTGASLLTSGRPVTIRYSSAATPRFEGAWSVHSVSIVWYSFLVRSTP